jgi:methylmalonyl-CoA mutase N-terminal domain/subunit
VDPLAGSYFVEAETNRLEAQAEQYFQEVEQRGGVVPAIDAGYFQREIHNSAVRYQRAVEAGRKRIVGVNTYVEDEGDGPPIEVHRSDPESERAALAELRALKSTRDGSAVKRELAAVREACHDGDNLLERFISAAHAYCTVGEIAQVLRDEFGEYREPKIF